jgi:hypothetical protein
MEATLNSIIALLKAGNIADARTAAVAGSADTVAAFLQRKRR